MGIIKIPNNASVMQAGLNAAGTIWTQAVKPCGVTNPASVVSSSSHCLNNQLPEPVYSYNSYYYGFGLTSTYTYAPNIQRTIIGKGAVPTQAELDSYSNTNYGSEATLPRYADALILLAPANAANNAVLNSAKIQLAPTVARLSGTATWFMILSTGYLDTNGTRRITRTLAVAGTVSDMSGSGDLKLATTNIIAGGLYKIPAISVPFPTKFSW